MLYYNKIKEKEGIGKTNGQDCHGKTNLKLQECYYCLNYFLYSIQFNKIKYNLICVMIAIIVNKEKKCGNQPIFEYSKSNQIHSELPVTMKVVKLLTYLKSHS